jgi:hypothetical protein
MKNVDGKKTWSASHCGLMLMTVIALFFFTPCVVRAASQPQGSGPTAPATATPVIVHPKFGGQILGYSIDPSGTEGVLSESFAETADEIHVATEIFDQTTGAIIAVVAEKNHAPLSIDYDTLEINAPDLGLVLFQDAGQNNFLTLNPLTANQFTGTWTPSGISEISVAQGAEVAVFENDLDAGTASVYGSNVAENTFGPTISLASIIDGDEFLVNPQIALDSATNEAVLADSHDCGVPNALCATSIALVNLTTGDISGFNDKLGVGQVVGLAVDPVKGIAVTITNVDNGVEFYNLTTQKGHKVILPSLGLSSDVEFDPLHKLFLVSQYISDDTTNPPARIYVYNESGKLLKTIAIPHDIGIGGRIALNPTTRTGFVPLVAKPQFLFLELQSFTY